MVVVAVAQGFILEEQVVLAHLAVVAGAAAEELMQMVVVQVGLTMAEQVLLEVRLVTLVAGVGTEQQTVTVAPVLVVMVVLVVLLLL